MAVFDRAPTDWNDLQQLVGQMFAEIGCETEIGKRVQTVRGAKEIDVFVRDTGVAPPAQYLCECKYWKRPVPQEIVHGFRTVVADYGAHRGFIISSEGFQRGAHEAAQNTNVDLVTFQQIQEMFEDRWRIAMGHAYMPFADRLFPYWDFPGKRPSGHWDQLSVVKQGRLVEAYLPFVRLGPTAERYGFRQQFPIVLPLLNDELDVVGEVRLETYRQYFDFLQINKELVFQRFQVLYGEVAT